MTEYEEAIDEMFALFNIAWQAGTSSIVSYIPEIQWPGVEPAVKQDASKYWCRVSQRTVSEEQSCLKNSEGVTTYTAEGNVFIQLFCPRSDSQSMQLGRKLAVVARNAFRGKTTSGKVWFRNCRIKELDPEEKYNRFNVVCDYQYDEQG